MLCTMFVRHLLATAILVAVCRVPAAAAQPTGQDPVTPPPVASPGPADAAKPYVIWLPVIYYTPETRLAVGAGGMLGFRLGHQDDQTRPSSLPFVFVYTQNKQLELVVDPDIYLPGNKYLLSGTLRFERMPQDFYGIGYAAAGSAPESYTPHAIGLVASVKKRYLGHLWAGVQYEFDRTTMKAAQPGGLLSSGAVTGSGGGIVSGAGVSVTLDTRDNVFFPRRGHFLQATADRYGRALGSDFSYTSAKLDLRAYRPVRTFDVLAAQVYLKSQGGAPPFYELSMLGGDALLRGYYRGRYRDMAVVVAQAEYRAHIWKRVGAAAFAGLGEVCAALDRCSARDVLPSAGGGLRIKLDPKGGTNLRVEYAVGRSSRAFYVTVQEAF
jgi:hypothetical protein